MSFPGDLLFPNVEKIHFRVYHLVQHLGLFLSPKLVDIDLEMDGPGVRLAVLPFLGAKCPSLTHVEVFYTGSVQATPEHRAQAASALIRSLNDIHSIYIGAIDAAACRHLTSLPNLTSLSIQMIHEPCFSTQLDSPHPSSQSAFLFLDTLNIHVARVELAFNFIPAVSQSHLDILDVSTEIPASEAQSRQLFAIIAEHCSPTSLSSIMVNLGDCTDDVSENAEAYSVVPATMRPLLAFSNLVTVCVVVPFGLCLDDAFVFEMAEAWPYLRDLRLHRPYIMLEPSPPSKITVSSLAVLARYCADLRSLVIPLSADLPESVDAPYTPRPTQTTLRSLCVLDSPIEASFPVAAFLSSVFPALTYISTAREGFFMEPEDDPAPLHAETHKKWKEVERLVPLLVAVRDQDEKHWREQLG